MNGARGPPSQTCTTVGGAPGEPPNAPGRDELIRLVGSFPYWYQRIYLGYGVYTLDHPVHHEGVWARLEPAFATCAARPC